MLTNLLLVLSVLALWLHFFAFLKKFFELHQLEGYWSAYCLRWGSEGERRPDDWFYQVAHNSRSASGDRFLGASLAASAALLVYFILEEQLTAFLGWSLVASILLGGLVLLSRWLPALERVLLLPIRPLGAPKFEVAVFREYHSLGMLLVALSGIASGAVVVSLYLPA